MIYTFLPLIFIANIGLSTGQSDYTNSNITAENGNLTLTTGNDANISGANLTSENTILNIANNLNVESKQTEEDYSSSGFGFSLTGGVGPNGNGGNIGGGINLSQGLCQQILCPTNYLNQFSS